MAGSSVGFAYLDILPRLGPGFGATLTSKLGGALGGLAKVGATAGLAAGVAVAGAAVKGVGEFAALEKSMNEVFTLLPGISDTAMGEMTDDVLTLSKQMGVLPETVVPSLYQALSAGVPAGNVFDFLETSVKAGIGGVTDTETAVDGLTTIINAWGLDVADAETVADSMFTTVRLGKTTFPELAAAMSTVAPIAASMGVGVDAVNAAVAQLTASGTPTDQAMTQVRASLVSLQRTTPAMEEALRRMGFESGQAALDALGYQGTMEALRETAGDMGVEMIELTGRVEGTQAVLGLTGQNTDAARAKLAEFASSAGASTAAFDQMDQGLSRSWDKIKATFAVAFAKIGQALSPFVQRFADWFGDKLPAAIDFFVGLFESIAGVLGPAFDFLKGLFSGTGDAAGEFGGRFVAIRDAIVGAFDVIRTIVGDVMAFFRSDSTATSAWLGETWETIKTIYSTAAEAVHVIISTLTSILQAIWERGGSGILRILGGLWDTIKGVFSGALTVIQGVLDVFVGVFTGDWQRMKNGLLGIWDGLWGAVKAVLSGAWEVLAGLLDTIVGLFGTTWDNIRTSSEEKWNSLIEWIKGIPQMILDALGDLGGLLYDTGVKILTGLWDGLKSVWENVTEWFSGITDAIPDWKGPLDRDRRLLIPAGEAIIEGLITGLDSQLPNVQASLMGLTDSIEHGVATNGARSGPGQVVIPITLDGDEISRHVLNLATLDLTVAGRVA